MTQLTQKIVDGSDGEFHFTSDFERQSILVDDELREFFMNSVVNTVTSGGPTDSHNLISNLQAFQIGFATLHDTRDEETCAEFTAAAQREAVGWERRMAEGEIITIPSVRAKESNGPNFRHGAMVGVQVTGARRRSVNAAAVRHSSIWS